MSDCIFCKIINNEIPCEKVYEDDKVISFKDISPAAPVHILIIPKQHIASINEMSEEHNELVGHIFLVAKMLAKQLGVSESGYRIVNNCGEQAGQTVKHVHFHMLGGRDLNWPPG